MEPLPQTTEAVDELEALAYDDDLLDQLRATATRVRAVAPECVGMSVTVLDQGVTLTLVASGSETAALDAVQYLDGGPCIAAVETGTVLSTDTALLDERGWQLFARASAARGVRSTLSMPVLDPAGAREGAVIGGVNLYGAGPDTFEGHHDELARLCGAWAGGAVANADLSFETRRRAREAPQKLRDDARIETAVGVLAHTLEVTVETARRRLHAAAASAGLPPVATARTVLSLLGALD